MEKVTARELKNKTVKVIIENPIGSVRKAGWTPYTYNYGFLKDFLNPIDQENWDVIIPKEENLQKDKEVKVKIIGVITQEEGDDNLIGILPGEKINKTELLRIEEEIRKRGYKNTKLFLF